MVADSLLSTSPRSYQIYLVPGINTEKHPYEAGDDNESLAAETVSPLAEQ